VTFCGHAYFMRGLSPMSAPRRSLHLEDAQTGKQLEITVDEPTGKVSPVRFFGAEDDAK
jgi:hypothetical protein